ncbi:MAG: SMU1112c/YaeR family gloxylase I-like metalloprotein [Peptostreptococcaceae bacterium]
MKFNQIHHVAIICSNYQVSKDFYVNKLGLEIINEAYREERDSFKLDLKLGTNQIELFSFPNPPSRPNSPESCGLRHLAFEVNDIDEAVEELLGKSIPVEEIRVDEYTGRRYTFFKDPDGLPLELYEI